MARGVALSVIRAKLKAELRDAQETNTALDAEYNYALANKQQDLANAYDWEFLQDRWDLAAATRYVALPTTNIRSISATINFERPVLAEVLFGTYYRELCYGIGSTQYNAIHEGVQQDPIQRWSLDTNVGDASNANEVEFWPTPATSQTVRFTAQREVRTLSSDSDKADLDDLLLVYMVAYEYLFQRQQANAEAMLQKANQHLVKLRASYSVNDDRMILGRSQTIDRKNVKLIAVR